MMRQRRRRRQRRRQALNRQQQLQQLQQLLQQQQLLSTTKLYLRRHRCRRKSTLAQTSRRSLWIAFAVSRFTCATATLSSGASCRRCVVRFQRCCAQSSFIARCSIITQGENELFRVAAAAASARGEWARSRMAGGGGGGGGGRDEPALRFDIDYDEDERE